MYCGKSSYSKLKNTGCFIPYNPVAKANGKLQCLHSCNGCNPQSQPCASRKCC